MFKRLDMLKVLIRVHDPRGHVGNFNNLVPFKVDS